MPNPLIKSLAKKSGKSKGDIEKGWKGGEKEAEKKGLTGDNKYAYMNAAAQHAAGKKGKKKEAYSPKKTQQTVDDNEKAEVLNNPKYSTPSQAVKALGDLSKRPKLAKKEAFDNDVQRGIMDQARATTHKPIDPGMVRNAFDLNKAKADKAGLPKDTPEYWSKVSSGTNEVLGTFNNDEDEFMPSTSHPSAKMFPEGYVSFEEELNRLTEKETPKDESPTPIPQKATRRGAAEELIKKLKKAGANRNEIIFSVVNQMGLDIESAVALYDSKEDYRAKPDWEPIDPLTPPNSDLQSPDDVVNSGETTLKKKSN